MSSLSDTQTLEPDFDLIKKELVESVYKLIGNPISNWAVAATIESLGIRDIDAKTDYGHENVFDLADYVYDKVRIIVNEEKVDKDEKVKLGNFSLTIKLFIKHYSEGLVFTMPMLSQIVSVLVFEYALWAWLGFNVAQATVIAFGTISAFIITGGFIQQMGRFISKYKGEGNYYLARAAIYKILKIAIPTVLFCSVLIFCLNLVLPFYPQRMVVLAMIYMLLISGFLLVAAILFGSEQRSMIFLSIVFGTAVVIVLMRYFNIGVYFAQWLGIFASTLMMGVYTSIYYRVKISSLKQELIKQTLPSNEVSFYNSYRFFIYGFCYFLFLFVDRLLAWSAGTPPPAYIIWFNTPYELGMDWALITFVITIAMLEFSIHAFSRFIIPAQKKVSASNMKYFNKYFKSFYNAQLMLVIIVNILSIVITYFGVLSLKGFEEQIPEIRDFFANPITTKVFWLASIGYIFLVIGLLNSLFFFTLNRPEFVMYSMIASLAVNFIVGFVCSRTFGLEYATIGLIAGSVTFAFSTGIIARRFFKHLDYFYYSAY